MDEIRQKNFIIYYNEYKHKIYSYFLYRIGYDRKMAEDLTSEVFLKALKHFDDFDQSKPFQAWIFRISHNHLVNYYKTAKRELSLTQVEDFVGTVDTGASERLELARVLKIIETMDDTDREILLMRYVQGLTNAEIAESLDKEEGAVRTQLSRSLAKLRAVPKLS